MTISQIWRRIASLLRRRSIAVFEGEITRLRAEIDRLRAENRALLNSILGIAGVPPIPTDVPTSCAEPPLSAHPAPPPGLEAPPSRPGASLRERRGRLAASGGQMIAPLRRRSWQQINRMLEFESGKKAVASDE
jgi:hypothetical protein